MTNFIGCLLSNIVLLALTHAVCWIARRLHPCFAVRATHLYLALLAIALTFDAALTYLVFAHAGGNWAKHDPRETFPGRAAAYALAAAVALIAAHVGARIARLRAARRTMSKALEIETSPYSNSTLPM